MYINNSLMKFLYLISGLNSPRGGWEAAIYFEEEVTGNEHKADQRHAHHSST
jgi:hypothetical protein